MSGDGAMQAYGLWSLVLINSAVFIVFAFSFAKPQSKRDWRSFGAFSAFLVALFTEMYGYPLTIYLLSGWLTSRFPGVDFLAHDAGHLLETMFGWRASPHFGPFHFLSFVLIGCGFWLLAVSWKALYEAQRTHRLAVSGPYARVRHPQYVGDGKRPRYSRGSRSGGRIMNMAAEADIQAGFAEARIPLWSRLFAVVDTLDAMTSDRAYRKARPALGEFDIHTQAERRGS